MDPDDQGSALPSFIHELPFGLLAFDDNGMVKEANSTLLEWLGRQPDDVIGNHIDRLLSPGGRIFYQTHLFPLLRSSGSVSELYIALQHNSGERLPVLLNARRVGQAESVLNLVAFVLINNRQQFEGALIEAVHAEQKAKEELARTSSELDKLNAALEARNAELLVAQAQLVQSNAHKDEFIGLVSHELRAPISTILANGALLLNHGHLLSEEQHQQSLTDVVSEAQRLQSIIENLLLLARLDTSHHLDVAAVDLKELVTERIEDFARRNPEREVRLNHNGFSHVVMARADLLVLVIDNLLGNADKYSPPSGSISIDIRRAGEENVEVHFKDQGIGLKEDDLTSLFMPFYRTEAGKSFASGMGLGLAVCKRIIDAHGGAIWASRASEGGAAFSFSLPSRG